MPSPSFLTSQRRHSVLRVVFGVVLATISTASLVAETEDIFASVKTPWHGFDRYDFVMDEQTLAIKPWVAPGGEGDGIHDPKQGQRRCVLVMPKEAAPGHPWSWRGCYWNHEPQTEIELLEHGFCVAYISANATLKPGREWDAWYAYLTEKRGLSHKPAFIGMSRGGQYSYLWATTHPDKVACIYADNPACDRESLGRLGDLAANDVPLFHVCGSIDPLYPDHSAAIENIYQQFGGRISVMIKQGFGHHPHSLPNPKPIVDFILTSVQETSAPAPGYLNGKVKKTAFYGTQDVYENFPDDGADIAYRGPFFTGCYDRYQFSVPGVEPFVTVIAPKTAAAGMPWVYRVGYVSRDARVDLALLAEGFHIVTGPVPYVASGPLPEQWTAVYQFLVEHGFSRKPAMEGSGVAIGDVYAWAGANPDKVSCIYAENPIVRQEALNAQWSHRIELLVKAGVPAFHLYRSADSLPGNATRALEGSFRELGGKITVMTRDADKPSPVAAEVWSSAADFIVIHAGK